MTKYIEDTLSALDLKIAMLTQTRKMLATIFQDWTIEVDLPQEVVAGGAVTGLGKAARPEGWKSTSARSTRAVKNGGAGRQTQQGRMAIASGRTFKEPFGSEALVKAIGCTRRNALNFINRWLAKGWLTRTSYGQYARTKTFGAGKEPRENGASRQSQILLADIHREIAAANPAA